MRFLNIGGNRKFYLKDFRNAYQFRPDVAPPRQKFQGYVNFVLNRRLINDPNFGATDNIEFRTRISSLVKTATLPEVGFKTEIHNSFNKKKIVQTGTEYSPVSITVHDTIQNEWITLFMKYFSYLYQDPKNKFEGQDRDPVGYFKSWHKMNYESKHGGFGNSRVNDGFDSNSFGLNLTQEVNFFERIDMILYHGQKGIQYSLMNPVMSKMSFSQIDYADSGFMDFQMDFEYEYFTTSNVYNFELGELDRARFEDVSNIDLPGTYVSSRKPVALNESNVSVLGSALDQRGRTPQFLQDNENTVTNTLAEQTQLNVTYEPFTSKNSKDTGFFAGVNNFLENNPFGRIISSGLSAKLNGQDPKDAAADALTNEFVQGIQNPQEGDIFDGRGQDATTTFNKSTNKPGQQTGNTGGGSG